MNLQEYQSAYSADIAVGWQAITNHLELHYPGEKVRHYPPLCGVHYAAGGTDPLDGISVYDVKNPLPHVHLISYGMSQLYYSEESVGRDFSHWGFEFTMRLAQYNNETDDPIWAMEVMNNLARYVNNSGRWYEENQCVPANEPIRKNSGTKITGFVVALDPVLGRINTPHGEVSFLQLVGVTQAELEKIFENPSTSFIAEFIEEMKKENPFLITDLKRE